MINGEVIAHVAIDSPTSSPTPVLTTWLPNAVNYPPELIAEMMMIDLPLVLAESIPQEFKCSAWAKRALNAGKYLWTGAVTAAGAVCCIGATVTAWAGCAVCAGAGGAVGAYVYDKLDNHCD